MIDEALLWPTVVGMGAMTAITRTAFLWLPEHWQPRGRAGVALSFVPALALIAIVAPSALMVARQALVDTQTVHIGGALVQVLTDARLPSAVVVMGVGALRRNALQALVAGVIVFVGLRWLLAGSL
jgi:hypothetical protein